MEAVADFIFLGSQITADSYCSHEIKRCLLLGRKAMANLDSILKSRDITLLTKVHIVKAMVFPVVMHRCQSCTIKKADHQRIDAFKLWSWRTLESSLDSKEINPDGRTDAKAEASIFWPPDEGSQLIGKGPDAGKDGRQREKRAAEDEMIK